MDANYRPDQIMNRFGLDRKRATFLHLYLRDCNRVEALRGAGYAKSTASQSEPVDRQAACQKVIQQFDADFVQYSPDELALILRSCIRRLEDVGFGSKRDELMMEAIGALLKFADRRPGALEDNAEKSQDMESMTPEQIEGAIVEAWHDDAI